MSQAEVIIKLGAAVEKAAHAAGLGHWPEKKDVQPCGCHWARVPHGWGGWCYERAFCADRSTCPLRPLPAAPLVPTKETT